MVREEYRFALELERPDETSLGQFGVTMDWEPAREWARLSALRAGMRDAAQSVAPIVVKPQWDAAAGEPFVGGVQVSLDGVSVVVPLTYFRATADRLAQGLVQQQLLKAGELYNFSVLAFPQERRAPARRGLAFTVEEVAPVPTLKRGRLEEFLDGAAEFGVHRAEDVPVFVPQAVLDEAMAMTRQAEANEIGGILIGHLCADDGGRDLFIEVTALIPARHTLSETTKLTFMPETWAAVDAAIKLRGCREQMLGWFHSHPSKYWCSAECPAEKRQQCILNRTFFSGEDCTLHRTVFPMAYGVALLVTHTDAGLNGAMFGWREGMIAQRGFHILNATNSVTGAGAAEVTIGGDNEKDCH